MQDMTEMEKLKAGLPYRYDDPELVQMKDTASLRCAKLNAVDPLDAAGREAAARELLGAAGPELDIQPGFHCDNGKNIRVGKRFTANFNVTILDGAPVTFGDFCMVGPGTLIATTGHPLEAQGRAVVEAKVSPVVEAETRALSDFTQSEREQAFHLLERYRDALEREFSAIVVEESEGSVCR